VKVKDFPEIYWPGPHCQTMRTKNWGAECFLPWVNGVAEHIGDPVARLRFLRVAVPCAQPHPTTLSRLRRFIPVLEFVVAALLFPAVAAVYMKFVKTSGPPAHSQAARKAPSTPALTTPGP
jgi:hypothetical protein